MVSYILDAMRYREGALGSVWITLGSINLSMLLSGAVFAAQRPLSLSLLIAICNGTTLFTTGTLPCFSHRSGANMPEIN